MASHFIKSLNFIKLIGKFPSILLELEITGGDLKLLQKFILGLFNDLNHPFHWLGKRPPTSRFFSPISVIIKYPS